MRADLGQLVVLTKFRYLHLYYYQWDYRSAGGLLVPEAHSWFIRHIYVLNLVSRRLVPLFT